MSTPSHERACRAKEPATCRVHGRASAANIKRILDAAVGNLIIELTAAVDATVPVYVADGSFATRMTQFDERAMRAAQDLHTFPDRNHVTRQMLTTESVGGEITHNLSPVIGWLHSDLSNHMGWDAYKSSDLRGRVDAVYAALRQTTPHIAAIILPAV